MKWTYRKWIGTLEVVYVSEVDNDDMETSVYCEATRYENSYRFEYSYVLLNSHPASILDIIKYKINRYLYER